MTVKELQNILDKIYDKNAPIDFSITFWDEDGTDYTSYFEPHFIQDDSYYKQPNKFVAMSFHLPPSLKYVEASDKEWEEYEKTSKRFDFYPHPLHKEGE